MRRGTQEKQTTKKGEGNVSLYIASLFVLIFAFAFPAHLCASLRISAPLR
jgi:hypothetical protein